MMYKFDHDQTNSHRIINERFGVEEWWSNIKQSKQTNKQNTKGWSRVCD